jgi:hypothetical protein
MAVPSSECEVLGLQPGMHGSTDVHGNKAALVLTTPKFPTIFGFRVRDRLPLKVSHRVGPATCERHHVIFPKTWTSAACFPGRWAGMLPLKLPRHFTRSISLAESGAGQASATASAIMRLAFVIGP